MRVCPFGHRKWVTACAIKKSLILLDDNPTDNHAYRYQPRDDEMAPSTDDRIKKALVIAMQSGSVDGADHKAWVIDQMVRALTNCPTVQRSAIDCCGWPYAYNTLGESPEYLAFVADHNDGDDGPNSYEWPTGIAP